MWLVAALLITAAFAPKEPLTATRREQAVIEPASRAYVVFLQSRPIGREEFSLIRQADGWILRGSSRIGPPIDIVTRSAEIHYTSDWKPTRAEIEGTSRGQEVVTKTTFAGGKANNELTFAGKPSSKVDEVTADTLVLSNALLTSYAVLARRLVGAQPGATFRVCPAANRSADPRRWCLSGSRRDGATRDQCDTARPCDQPAQRGTATRALGRPGRLSAAPQHPKSGHRARA